MKPWTVRLFFILFTFILLNNLMFAGESKAPVLVTTSWLAEHINDADLVILQVSQSIRDYHRGHIPGARFLWISSIASPTSELSFELPSVEHLDTLLEGLGISNSSRIILCCVNGNVSPTARVYATLEYLGMSDRTSILDGGFDVWKNEKRPVSTTSLPHARGSFTPKLKPETIVDYSFVKERLHKPGVSIVDARAPQFYNGNGGGFPRPGRIPGARNVYFTTLFDTSNKYLPLDSLRVKFQSAGVMPGDEIVTYCHVGQTASADYIAAKLLGYNVHLYDGSFEDWSGRDDLPVELEKPTK